MNQTTSALTVPTASYVSKLRLLQGHNAHQYADGFVCVITGCDQPVGAAIALELASKCHGPLKSFFADIGSWTAHGAACIYGTFDSSQYSSETS